MSYFLAALLVAMSLVIVFDGPPGLTWTTVESRKEVRKLPLPQETEVSCDSGVNQ